MSRSFRFDKSQSGARSERSEQSRQRQARQGARDNRNRKQHTREIIVPSMLDDDSRSEYYDKMKNGRIEVYV